MRIIFNCDKVAQTPDYRGEEKGAGRTAWRSGVALIVVKERGKITVQRHLASAWEQR